VLPENDPLRQQLVPSSASVFIRHRASMQMDSLVPQIKMLVANGVAGLSYDKVSVILVPVQAHDSLVLNDPKEALRPLASESSSGLFYGFGLLAVGLGGALAFVLWRHRRVYPLPPSELVKSQ
jgi:type III secretion protein J